MFILGLHNRLTWTLTVTNTVVALMWLNMYAGCVALVHGFKSQSRLFFVFFFGLHQHVTTPVFQFVSEAYLFVL